MPLRQLCTERFKLPLPGILRQQLLQLKILSGQLNWRVKFSQFTLPALPKSLAISTFFVTYMNTIVNFAVANKIQFRFHYIRAKNGTFRLIFHFGYDFLR